MYSFKGKKRRYKYTTKCINWKVMLLVLGYVGEMKTKPRLRRSSPSSPHAHPIPSDFLSFTPLEEVQLSPEAQQHPQPSLPL